MRKSIFISLKTLFAAARSTLYTRPNPAAKTNLSPDPLECKSVRTQGLDGWMFDKDVSLEEATCAASGEMTRLSHSLERLGTTLQAMSDHRAGTYASGRPCDIHLHDSDLFDGEEMPLPPSQDTTIGGESAFLFGDAPVYHSTPAQHAA